MYEYNQRQIIVQTCLLVRLSRIFYDLHSQLHQYAFKRRSPILRCTKTQVFNIFHIIPNIKLTINGTFSSHW